IEMCGHMQDAFVGEDKKGAFEKKKSRSGHDAFQHAGGRIAGGQALDLLAMVQEEFDERAFDDQFPLALLDCFLVSSLVVGENGVAIHGDAKDREWLAKDIQALGRAAARAKCMCHVKDLHCRV
ncbi:MAG: hypothetical protein HZB87_12535, partial [Desulfatitalea sp.]|nr:hypothetical protein [Desulfatitalea sp.]